MDAPAMAAIGYHEMAQYVRGELSAEKAVGQIRKATRSLIRHQMNWFWHDDPRIQWIESDASAGARGATVVREWLAA